MKNNGVFIFFNVSTPQKINKLPYLCIYYTTIIFNHLVPEMTDGATGAYVNSSQRGGIQRSQYAPEYVHTLEGPDDMPAHAKSTLSGVSLTVPITNGRLNLGTWQGIYFCEYRNYGGARKLVVTIVGE